MKYFSRSLLLSLFASAVALASAPRMDDAAFATACARVPAGHPRLMGGVADFERLRDPAKTDPVLIAGVKAVLDHAAYYAGKPTLERRLEGRRLLSVCRSAVMYISATAMAYRLTGEKRYLEAAVRQLEAVCAFVDWNPKHFLDVSEMSLAVALGYDWLYSDLTEEQRERIEAALKEKGFEAFRKDVVAKRSRMRAGNNWGQVCNCGAIAATLALWDKVDATAAREMLRGSVERLRQPMRVYAPNGAYPEGPGYWEYGTSFNVIAISLLEHACGTDFGLGDVEGFRATAYFRDWVTGPSGSFFNYSDSSLDRVLSVSPWWFAAHGEPGCLEFFERGALEKVARNRREGLPRNFPCALFWLGERQMPAVARPRVWTSGDETGIAVLRSDWTKDGWFAAFKYGMVGGAHGHLDVGSFVFDAWGQRWAGDIGSVNYNRAEQQGVTLWSRSQNSSRWQLYRISNASHNVVNPEGVLQKVGTTGRLIYARERGGAVEAAYDLDAIYAPAIGGWKRRATLTRGSFRIEDDITGVDGKQVTWGFSTKAKASVDGKTVVLKLNDRTMTVRAESPASATWTIGPAEGAHPADAKNPGWTRVTLNAPAVDGAISYKVVFE